MDEPKSTISDTLGISVFGLLTGLSALSFLIANLFAGASRPAAEVAPPAPILPAAEELIGQVKAASESRDALQRELETLRREQGDASGTIETLMREKEALTEELTATGAERDAVKLSLAEGRAAIDAFAREKAEIGTLRAAIRGEVDRLKGELQAAKRKAEDDAKAWAVARAGLESSSRNLAQQNELLKNRLAEGMKSALPDSGENAKAALNLNEAVIAKLREQIVALEQKLDALGIQRNELARALRSAQVKEPSASPATALGQGPEP